MSRLTILGAGAWGTALAATAVRAGQSVCLWGRNAQNLEALKMEPKLQSVILMNQLNPALESADFLVFALPAQQVRPFFGEFSPHVPVIMACKGMEVSTGHLISEVLNSLAIQPALGFLGGPNLAGEVLQELPTAGTLAAKTRVDAEEMAKLFRHSGFQIMMSTDLWGVQVCGALKNVFALTSGLLWGAGLGENARAAALTQGLSDMRQFGCALGAQEQTFLTQTGLGDLILTCMSSQSRNTRFGISLARGENPDPYNPLAEGFFTTLATLRRAKALGIRLPLVEKLAKILEIPKSAPALIPHLMEFAV